MNAPQLEGWNIVANRIFAMAKNNEVVEPLGKGACLIRGAHGIPPLGEFLKLANDYQIPYRIFLIVSASGQNRPGQSG